MNVEKLYLNSKTRILKNFAFFPTKISDGKYIWFKSYIAEQKYVVNEDYCHDCHNPHFPCNGHPDYWETVKKSLK